MIKKIRAYLFISALLLPHTNVQALVINVNDLTGGTQATALTAFQQAAGIWKSVLQDDVTVNIDFNFSSLPPGVIGSTSTITVGASFSGVKSALALDVTSTNDVLAVTNLPSGSSINFLTNNVTGAGVFDNDGSVNNTVLSITRANAKALGIINASDTGTDASIGFSSTFGFDFNAGDGLTGFDFVGIAAHEIGHALGFVSGVDIVDITSGVGPSAPFNINNLRVFSVLDLFRYSSASLAQGAGVLDLSTGDTPYFSIDGGFTNLATFSTGNYNGDGRQASHWKDNLGLGIMDPTVAPSEFLQVSTLDQRAFDVIGWDFFPSTSVPLPSTLFLMLIGAAGGIVFRRR